MGMFLDVILIKCLPFLKKRIYYRIKDVKGNWHTGFAQIKKGERSFKWQKWEYKLAGMPEYDNDLNIRVFQYLWNCPYPININPDDPELVSFSTQARQEQLDRTMDEQEAYLKMSLIKKKDEKQQQMLFILLVVCAAVSVISLLILFQIMGRLPAPPA